MQFVCCVGRCLSQFERPGKPDLSLRLELVGRQAFSKASIRLAMRSPSDRARDRYAGTSWHGARGPPGACVGRGSGPGSKCRQGKRATDLSGIYQADLYLLLACNWLRVATKRGRCRVRAELCSKESPLSCSTRLHSNEHNRKQPLFFLPAHPPQKEQLEAECGCLHFGDQDRSRFGLRV